MFDFDDSAITTMSAEMSRDLAHSQAEDLAASVIHVRTTQRLISGFLAAIGIRARELQGLGIGSPVEEVMHHNGRVSASEAMKDASRSGVGLEMPLVGAALLSGAASPENVDAVVRTLGRLTKPERRSLRDSDSTLAHKAVTLPPESYARMLRRMVAEIRQDSGLADHLQQRKDSRATIIKAKDGMHYLNAAFDLERGA